MRSLVASVAWLVAGQAVVGGLFWTFLHTPESNIWMLVASLLLVVLMLMAASVATLGALDAWRRPLRQSPVRGLRHVPAFLLALGVAVAIWSAAGLGDAWVDARSGEISAWFIATLDWDDASLFFRGVRAVVFWLQWVAAPVVGLIFLATLSGGGFRARAGGRRALSLRVLALATVWVIVLVVLPLQVLNWRMLGLPPTWIEPAVVGARLMLVALTATIGWALVCATVVTMGPAPLLTSRDNRGDRPAPM